MTSIETVKTTRKSKKQTQYDEGEVPELTKEETQIARYLRLKCPNRQANLVGMKVDYFIASKLIDCLMESKWGPGTLDPKSLPADAKTPLLETRHACFKYMQRLMQKQLFYRAIKIYKEQPADAVNESSSNLRKRKNKENKENKEEAKPESTPGKTSSEKKEPKKKFKLEMHEEQKFIDTNEPYVWVYDPTSVTTYIIGLLLILGAIGICCFPLWPSNVREGVYYLSLAGSGFLGSIVALALLKYVIYSIVWLSTLGKFEFWIFPNLTEDVGFFESFVPFYSFKKSNSKPKEVKSDENDDQTNDDQINDDQVNDDQVNDEKQDAELIGKQNMEENSKESGEENEPEELVTTSRELTDSTVEISTIRASESVQQMDKINEDYDFEIVDEVSDKEENNEAENNGQNHD